MKIRVLVVLALMAFAAVFAADAGASPALSMSFARQQMQKFVIRQLVEPTERDGGFASSKIDSCWRVSSSRVNCHVSLDTHKDNEVDGSDMRVRCSGTWTAWRQPGWLIRIKNATWACSRG